MARWRGKWPSGVRELSGNGATTVAHELGGDGAVRGGFALAWREIGEARQRITNAGE